jgi:hypothetical protein
MRHQHCDRISLHRLRDAMENHAQRAANPANVGVNPCAGRLKAMLRFFGAALACAALVNLGGGAGVQAAEADGCRE